MITGARALMLVMLVLAGSLLTLGAAAAAPSVYYPNCTAARAAGATNIPRGAPGYRRALDADNDGIACESGSRSTSAGTSSTSTSSTSTSSTSTSSTGAARKTRSPMPSGGIETGDGSYPLDAAAADPATEVSTGWSGVDTAVVVALGVGVLAYAAAAAREPRRR